MSGPTSREALATLRSRSGSSDLRSDQPALEQWRPISSAPRDGTVILLADHRQSVAGFWHKAEGVWSGLIADDEFPWVFIDPTLNHYINGWLDGVNGPSHWMPLPAPPTAESEDGS